MKPYILLSIIVICGIALYGPSKIKNILSVGTRYNMPVIPAAEDREDRGGAYADEDPKASADDTGSEELNIYKLSERETDVSLSIPYIDEVITRYYRTLPDNVKRTGKKNILYQIAGRIFKKKATELIMLATGILVSVVVVCYIANIAGLSFISSIAGNLLFLLARLLLMAIPILSIMLYFAYGRNIWTDFGYNLYVLPVELLLISSVILKMHDFNFPVWNRVLVSLILPFIAGVMIFIMEMA